MKTCTGCGDCKPHWEFHRDSNAPDGHRSRCKTCLAVDKKAAYDRMMADPERWRRHKTVKAAYRDKNRERVNARGRDYFDRNRPRFSQNASIYRAKNPDKAKARSTVM